MYVLIGQIAASVIVGFLAIGFVVYFLYNGFGFVSGKLKDKQYKEYSKPYQLFLTAWSLVMFACLLAAVAFVGYSVLHVFGW